MNLLCPNCQKMLTVAEQFAGQTMKCPSCTGAFTVPGLPPGGMTAAPPPPPPPPSYTAPSYPMNSDAPPQMGGYLHTYSIVLRPEVLSIVAPLALFMNFIFLFFSWIESGVGVSGSEGTSSFTGWQTAFGEFSSIPGTLYALFFIMTMLLSFVAGVLSFIPTAAMPPAVRPFLPWIPALVSLGALLCLFLLVLQLVSDFGPEDVSVTKKILEGVRTNKDLTIKFSHTFPLRLVVFCEILAVVGGSMTTWLNLRGKQTPAPRIDLNW